jgi:hypothetical protein
VEGTVSALVAVLLCRVLALLVCRMALSSVRHSLEKIRRKQDRAGEGSAALVLDPYGGQHLLPKRV